MSQSAIYRMAFFTGDRFVILLKKPVTQNITTLIREGVEMMAAMHGMNYHYYIAGIPTPVSKKYMTMSVAVNETVKQFRKTFPSREVSREIWMFYESNTPGVAIPVRYFILSEHEVNIT